MIEIPDIEFFGCKIFIDTDEQRIAEAVKSEIERMWKETYQKPDWYYRALAKERLGT